MPGDVLNISDANALLASILAASLSNDRISLVTFVSTIESTPIVVFFNFPRLQLSLKHFLELLINDLFPFLLPSFSSLICFFFLQMQKMKPKFVRPNGELRA